jgi:hypothetical protein
MKRPTCRFDETKGACGIVLVGYVDRRGLASLHLAQRRPVLAMCIHRSDSIFPYLISTSSTVTKDYQAMQPEISDKESRNIRSSPPEREMALIP